MVKQKLPRLHKSHKGGIESFCVVWLDTRTNLTARAYFPTEEQAKAFMYYEVNI